MKISAKDVILITLAVLLGGAGTASAVLKLANRYIDNQFKKYYKNNIEKENFRVVVNRLKRSGLLEKDGGGVWRITKKGEKAAGSAYRQISYDESKNKRKNINTIVIFDIPEQQRKKRDYLRIELVSLNFKPLQKSVWIGGGPLPMAFIEYLKDMRLLDYIHIFTVKEFGTVIT